MIIRSYKDGAKQLFYPDGLAEFWLDKGRFRVTYGDMWGDGALIVCDGETVLDDPQADPVTLRPAGKTLVEASPTLAYKGTAVSPFFYFLEGPKLLDRLDKDREIKQVSETEILWDSSLFGKTRISYEPKEGRFEIQGIEYDYVPWQKEMSIEFPEWFEEPDPLSTWRHRLVVSRLGRVKRDLFSTKPGRNREVTDLRPKAKKPSL